MWPNVRRALDSGDEVINDLPDLALAHPPTAASEEERRSRCPVRKRPPSPAQPCVQSTPSGDAERHDPLLPTLTRHPQQAVLGVDVVDVEPAELSDAHAGGVEHFEHRRVAKSQSDRRCIFYVTRRPRLPIGGPPPACASAGQPIAITGVFPSGIATDVGESIADRTNAITALAATTRAALATAPTNTTAITTLTSLTAVLAALA